MMNNINEIRFGGAVQPGDYIHFNGDTNRIRRIITYIDNGNHGTVKTFIRPSRGYARHIRRTKATQQK